MVKVGTCSQFRHIRRVQMAKMGIYKDGAKVVGWRLSPKMIAMVEEMAEDKEMYQVEFIRQMIKVNYAVWLKRKGANK